MQKRQRLRWIRVYALGDFFAAAASWYALFLFRKVTIEANAFSPLLPFRDNNFWIAIVMVPLLWLLIHYLTGTYTDLYRKSRVQELGKTTLITITGSILIFFLLLLDDFVRKYSDYYLTFFVFSSLQLFFTAAVRLLLLNRIKRDMERGKAGFDTLMVGSSAKAAELYEDICREKSGYAFRFIGYLELNGSSENILTERLPRLGNLANLESVISENPELEEVIIAIETSEHHLLNEIINRLADKNVSIRIIPDMYDILSGTVRMNHVIGEGFIEIPPVMLSEWARITKRWFDVAASFLALIVTLPVTVFVAIKIWLTDRGGIFYTQERLGLHGKPFLIYKFRSMYLDAEVAGPQLTTENDRRITPVGKWIRKYRIDELPQFWNVIKGDMSIVGPRAERKFFADQIVVRAPYYRHVFRVQPGITSLGMVKYGYASTVDEMIKRLKYDVIYIENMSFLLDLKILAYTVQTVIYGRGK